MNLTTLGRHILIEYYDCDETILCDTKKIEKLMINAAQKSGATIITSTFHEFNPYGVSGAIIISESHFTIHTWPEYKYASVDIYTCGEKVDPWIGFKYLEKELNSTHSESTEFPRGVESKIKAYQKE